MNISSVFTNDMLELRDREFYYSYRRVDGAFDVFRTHAHNHYELYFLADGNRNYFIKNRIIRITSGDMVLIPPNTIHKTTSVPQSGHERLLINFTDSFLDKSIKERVLLLFNDYCISIPNQNIQLISDLFKRISCEYKKNDVYSMTALRSLLTELFIELLRIDNKTIHINTDGKSEKHIKKVLDSLENNITEYMTVDMAAELAELSKSHFEKIFRELTGFTFIDYLNTQRLLKAQKLLVKSEKSITDIAFECGFNSSTYFTTVFKKYIGITPLKFRRKERGD